jgi:uncharacterized protein YbcI
MNIESAVCSIVRHSYAEHLGHWPDHICCQTTDHTMAIVLSRGITQPERLLTTVGKEETAYRMRHALNRILQSKLLAAIPARLDLPITDMFTVVDTYSGDVCITLTLASSIVPQTSDWPS